MPIILILLGLAIPQNLHALTSNDIEEHAEKFGQLFVQNMDRHGFSLTHDCCSLSLRRFSMASTLVLAESLLSTSDCLSLSQFALSALSD